MIYRQPQKAYKNIILTFFALLIICIVQAQTVYITKTGAKYHKETCSYLKYSKIAISLKDAQDQGYTACKVCKPASGVTKTEELKTESSQEKPNQKLEATVRCSATTQGGTQCKRMTSDPSGKCWQHK